MPPYFESILDLFIHLANYKENTVNDVEWVVRKYLRFFSDKGHTSLADVSMEDVRSFIMKTAMEVKSSTLHDIFLYLRHFHLYLKRESISAPDAEGIFSYTIHREMPIQGYITDEELREILSVIDTTTESGCRDMAIILLAVTTGIRACDVIRLKLTDTRNNRLAALRAFIYKYRETARLKCPEVPEHIHLHMWKHTRTMHLYRHGMPLELVAQWLEHRNPTTTLVYAYADTEHKREAIEKAMEHSRVTTELSASNREPAYRITDEELLKRLYGLE